MECKCPGQAPRLCVEQGGLVARLSMCLVSTTTVQHPKPRPRGLSRAKASPAICWVSTGEASCP